MAQQDLQNPFWVIRTVVGRPTELGRVSRKVESVTTFWPVALAWSVLAFCLGWLLGGWSIALLLPVAVWLLVGTYHLAAILLGGQGRWLALAGAMSRLLLAVVPIAILVQLVSMSILLLVPAGGRLNGPGSQLIFVVQAAIALWAIILTISVFRGVYELPLGRAVLAIVLVQILFPLLVALARPLLFALILRLR